MFEIIVPELAESLTEGTIAAWLKKEGEHVQKGEPIVELETDKINIEINSENDGVIKQFLFKPGDTVLVGQVIAILIENESRLTENNDVPEEKNNVQKLEDNCKVQEADVSASNEENEKPNKNQVIASPAARKKAREIGVDINEIPYKDPLGRIRAEDVEVYKQSQLYLQKEVHGNGAQNNESIVNDDEKLVERVKMSRRRQTIAARLLEAQHHAAMLTTFNEVDMSAIIDIRKRRKESFYKKHGAKLGFMSFFTKAVIGALKEFPLLNAEIKGDEILLKKFYDIGIAVSTDDGLVVPVVRRADRLSFAGIEKEIEALSEKARMKMLGLQDLQGGTFTITNGGIFGSLYSMPILNTPQVGILGMHKIQRRPVVIDDEDTIAVRPMMYVALSYDHRIIDGKEAVQFLVRVKELLESPEDLLLEG